MNTQNHPPQSRNTEPKQSQFYPEEIIENLLSRLPVKSLCRFSCVSASWRSLIGTDRFVKTHLRKSMENSSLAHHRVVLNHRNRCSMSDCSLSSFLRSIEGPIVDLISNPRKTGNLVGCCNGVLCFFNQADMSFYLWNPGTRISQKLPKLGSGFVFAKFGFGWDESNDAYKVFAVLSEYNQIKRIGRVYSSKTNSWKTVEHGILVLFGISGHFLRGKIHWATYPKNGIESFDLEREEFGKIELPFTPDVHYYHLWLGEIRGCLCLMGDDRKHLSLDVWVMHEYGVKESWLKMVTFSLVTCERTIYALNPLLIEGLNGEIVLIYGDTSLVYSPKLDKVFPPSKNTIGFSEARVYVESLVSPRRILGLCDTHSV